MSRTHRFIISSTAASALPPCNPGQGRAPGWLLAGPWPAVLAQMLAGLRAGVGGRVPAQGSHTQARARTPPLACTPCPTSRTGAWWKPNTLPLGHGGCQTHDPWGRGRRGAPCSHPPTHLAVRVHGHAHQCPAPHAPPVLAHQGLVHVPSQPLLHEAAVAAEVGRPDLREPRRPGGAGTAHGIAGQLPPACRLTAGACPRPGGCWTEDRRRPPLSRGGGGWWGALLGSRLPGRKPHPPRCRHGAGSL